MKEITGMKSFTLYLFVLLGVLIACPTVFAAKGKPNILLIMSDDVGISNISAYSDGLVGYHTPNIDRIANEGMRLTDYYAEQSCTAGRSAFITGQSPVRTGLTKVGMPGADIGLRAEDPTLAELLKPHGYMTGQFGKNHLGDKDEFLPSNHGFDELTTDSTNFSATSTTSMPRKNLSIPTTRKTRSSARSSVPAASFVRPRTAKSRIPAL
jgi:arylsulfatase